MPEYFHSGICDACMYLMPCNEHLGDIDLDLFKIRHIYTTPIFTDESIDTLKISQNPDEEAKESFNIPWQLRDDGYVYSRWIFNPMYSDLTTKCKGEVFPAHRVIESEKNEIILDDHNPFRIRKMLELMYRGDYVVHVDEIQYLDKPEHMRPFAIKSEPEVSEEEEEAERDPGSYYDSTTHRTRNLRAIFHAQMYSVGDYFQILRLQSWAFEEFYREFTPVAFARYSEGQKAFCMAVSEVYNSTPPSNPGLRRVVVKKTVEKLCCQGRAENPILNRETLRRVTEFAIDVCVEALDWLNTADE